MAKLRRSDIAACRVDLVDDDLAPTTVTRCLAVLKKALTDAWRREPDQIERRFLTLDDPNRIEAAIATRWRSLCRPRRAPGLRLPMGPGPAPSPTDDRSGCQLSPTKFSAPAPSSCTPCTCTDMGNRTVRRTHPDAPWSKVLAIG
jgi:hypothetical protein